MPGPYVHYNGPIGIQTVGAEVLTQLTPDMLVYLVNDGPLLTVTTLGTLAAFLSTAPAVEITATGNDAGTALQLPANVNFVISVPPGTGVIIPDTATPGSIWDIWNDDPNNDLLVYPFDGAQIQNFGGGVPATVVAGGRSTFGVGSATQIYAR